jgi:hypothetical protein
MAYYRSTVAQMAYYPDTDLPLFSLILRLALLMDLPKAAVLVPSSIDPTPHDCMLGGQAGRQQARTMCHRTLRWLGSTRIIDLAANFGAPRFNYRASQQA